MSVKAIGQRILVPYDGSAISAQAFSLALGLAHPGGALTIVHVDEGEGHDIQRQLEPLAGALRAHAPAGGLRIDAVTARHPNAGEGILAEADRLGADLIVMSTRGRGGLARMAFGSVTDDIVRRGHHPVAVVHADDSDYDSAMGEASRGPYRFRRIILPLDGSETSAAALPVAADLASRESVPVLLVSTVNLVPLTSPGMVQDVGMAASMDQLYDDTREAADGWLADASRTLAAAGVASSTEVMNGSAGPAIAGLARAGDLIIMATHGRTGFDRVLSGSVSDQVIRSGVAPVLIVRSIAERIAPS